MEDSYMQCGELQVLEPANQESFDLLQQGGEVWETFEFEVDLDSVCMPLIHAANVIQQYFAHLAKVFGLEAVHKALKTTYYPREVWDDAWNSRMMSSRH